MEKAFNDVQAAKFLNHHVQTLRNWRAIGKGPAYIKQGRSVRYYEKDLQEFIDNNRIVPRN